MADYHRLEVDRIVKMLEKLSLRIQDGFAGGGLTRLCTKMLGIARDAEQRAAQITRPLVALRLTASLLVVTIVAVFVGTLLSLDLHTGKLTGTQFLAIVESSINALLLVGAAIFFLVTLETRVKRKRALRAVQELRAIAHVIDMHQLSKNPQRLLSGGIVLESSPDQTMTADQLARYFEFCGELMSIAGKLTVVQVQDFNDSTVQAAVGEVESLTTGLSRNIWQKLVILHSIGRANPTPDQAEAA